MSALKFSRPHSFYLFIINDNTITSLEALQFSSSTLVFSTDVVKSFFVLFLLTVRLKDSLLSLSQTELNQSLSRFVKEVRRPNGESYAPDSILYLCLSIQKVRWSPASSLCACLYSIEAVKIIVR